MSTESMPPYSGGVWPPPPTSNTDDETDRLRPIQALYRSPIRLSRWMLRFLAVTVAANVTATLGVLLDTSRAPGVLLSSAGTMIMGITSPVTGILFLAWVYRLYKNLTSFGIYGLRRSPTVAIIMFFVPVVNLYKPIGIVAEIWRASSPESDLIQTKGRWKEMTASPIIMHWWIAYLAYNLITMLAQVNIVPLIIHGVFNVLIPHATVNLMLRNSLNEAAYMGASVLCVISGVLLAVIAMRLSKRQEHRHTEIAASL